MKYTIYKSLVLRVEVEADTPADAYDDMLDMDDNTFTVIECDYEMFVKDGNLIDPEDYEVL